MSKLLSGLALCTVLATTTPASADPLFGVSTDVGVPDGAMASLVVRPLSYFRAHAGAGYNAISPGYRVGATLSLPTWISPTVSVAYGRYQEGDANPLVRRMSGDKSFQSDTLERVGYSFADGYLGLQLGRKRFVFHIEAGYSRIEGRIRDLPTVGEDMPDSGTSSTTVSINQDPTVVAWSISARIGITLFIK